ncbi:MAG TPA: DUF5343 domain-containing protein [Gemmatimonadaceae bacterium]|nr:DUF5343 domain-containing protein [Gemmatimonadaceae bacterium]
MAEQLPYVPSYGLIAKVLNKIKTAATPDRFTHDFLSTKLGMTGGSARSLPPFLKRIGFLGTDGSPTEIYKRFRNPSESGRAAAAALRAGYRSLYEMNEYAHDLPEKDLKGLLVQATGLEPDSGTVKAILGSFKTLKQFATFEDGEPLKSDEGEEPPANDEEGRHELQKPEMKLGLSYTINLNLPATSDIAVFNAIFKSLREHLLK